MVSGLMAWNSEGSYTKRLQAGHPAFCGIYCRQNGEEGFNGPSDIYEGVSTPIPSRTTMTANGSPRGSGKKWEFTTSRSRCILLPVFGRASGVPVLNWCRRFTLIPRRSRRYWFVRQTIPSICWPSEEVESPKCGGLPVQHSVPVGHRLCTGQGGHRMRRA